jgi:PAS domain S-box-containing protein
MARAANRPNSANPRSSSGFWRRLVILDSCEKKKKKNMIEPSGSSSQPLSLGKYAWGLVAVWTVAVTTVLWFEVRDEQYQADDIARTEANTAFRKDHAVLEWYAARGGIYASPVEQAGSRPPQTASTSVPDQEAKTSSGRSLRLLDPVHLVRQLDKLADDKIHTESHLVPLDARGSGTPPDAWEQEALKALEQGQPEVFAEAIVRGEPSLRLMRPLQMEKQCLKCHSQEGHKPGDLAGAISVSLPLASVQAFQRDEVLHRLLGYGATWAVGIVGIAVGNLHLRREVRQRHQAEQRLQEAHDLLEQRVAERTAELAKANQDLANEIADRKQAERWLLESEERFRGYFELGLVGMALTAPDKTWLEVNPRFCEMLGYTEEELLGRSWVDVTHPEDVAAEETRWERIQSGLASGYSMTKRFVHRDGRIIYGSISVKCLRQADGTIDSLLTLVEDVSEHKRIEDSLRRVSSRYEAILSTVPDIIVDVDANGNVTWANQAGTTFFGPDLMNRPLPFALGDGQAAAATLVDGPLASLSQRTWQRHSDGQPRRLAWSCQVLKDAAGTATGALLIARDVTDNCSEKGCCSA